jgi:succinate-acetate transporter protein
MEGEATVRRIADTTSNPAPLGLMGFGMTTELLNLHNAGVFGLGSMILAMGIFYGGVAQIIAGIMEWKTGNTFGTTAFTSYGLFWLTFVGLVVFPTHDLVDIAAPANAAVISYLVMWGIFTFVMFIGTLRLNRALQTIFLSLTILFFLLAICDATGSKGLKVFTGIEGIFCGLSAIYAALAQVLNEVYGKTVWPLGVVKK